MKKDRSMIWSGKSHTLMSVTLVVSMIPGLFSCSSVRGRRSLFKEDKSAQTVPKEQYDSLLEKYQKLVKETRTAPMNEQAIAAKVKDGKMANRQSLLDDISAVNNRGELAETVDVFSESSQQAAAMNKQYESGRVTEEIKALRKGIKLVNQNKFSESLALLKGLEKSDVRHISVQAKYHIGEVLFRQSEYDLAMQTFEEIIRKDAFSGMVLKALGRLIVCTEKLKLNKKRERY